MVPSLPDIAGRSGYFFVPEPCDAAADAGDVEEQLGVLLGKSDKIFHVRLDGFHAALHRRDGITLSPKADTASHHGAELLEGHIGRSAAMHSGKVATKHKDLSAFNSVMNSGVNSGRSIPMYVLILPSHFGKLSPIHASYQSNGQMEEDLARKS